MVKESKKAFVFRTMDENADKPMVDVLPLLMTPFEWDEATAKSYYMWAVRKGFAKGQAPAGRGRSAAPKTKEVSAKKLLKEVGLKPSKPAKVSHEKSVRAINAAVKAKPKLVEPDNIAEIRAANLARLQAVTKRHKKTKVYTNVAMDDGPGVENFDPEEARAEVRGMIESLDSWKAPKHLSADEVKALV